MISDETIRKVAGVIDGILSADPQVAREMFGDEPDRIARALADEGLLAPAPLREEWGSEMRNARPGGITHVLAARGRQSAQWQIDNNPDWATGRIMHRFVTEWEEA